MHLRIRVERGILNIIFLVGDDSKADESLPDGGHMSVAHHGGSASDVMISLSFLTGKSY